MTKLLAFFLSFIILSVTCSSLSDFESLLNQEVITGSMTDYDIDNDGDVESKKIERVTSIIKIFPKIIFSPSFQLTPAPTPENYPPIFSSTSSGKTISFHSKILRPPVDKKSFS